MAFNYIKGPVGLEHYPYLNQLVASNSLPVNYMYNLHVQSEDFEQEMSVNHIDSLK